MGRNNINPEVSQSDPMAISPLLALAALAVAGLLPQAPRPAAVIPAAVIPIAVIPIAVIPMSWRVERVIEPDSGHKACRVLSLGGDVIAILSRSRRRPEAAWSVTIGVDNRPGSLRYLRIEEKIFQTAEPSFRGAAAADIVARLKAPATFVFEWIQDFDEAKRGGLFGAGDFAAKAAECETWLLGTRA